MKDLFSMREKEIYNILKELKQCEFVIIGGYAVNAYTLPRFSIDCDIVIKDKNELKKIEKILLKNSYVLEDNSKQAQYSGIFSRYEKKIENGFMVSIDILIKNVTDRMTESIFSAEWIFDNSTFLNLKGKTITEELLLRIINVDALSVMKMISCRATDIRDVFMILPESKNKEWIKSEISLRFNFQDRWLKMNDKVNSKQFKDGLSGVYGYFDQKIFDKHLKAILNLEKE